MRLLVAAALVTACGIAVSGCGKGSEAEVPVGAAAGRVVELTGKVVATRGGATRVLAVGHEVFRDDVVATNDGAVTIELFHNQARWVVDAAKTKRVDESAAWGLAKQDRPSQASQHATSAAGRNGERTAADTAATAHTGDLKQDLEKAADKKSPANDEAPDGFAGGKVSGSAAATPPVKNELPRSPEAVVPRQDKLGVKTEPPPTNAPKPTEPPKDPRGVKADPESQLDRNRASLAALYERERGKLVACLDSATPKVKLHVTVKGGVATVAVPPGVPLTVVSCLSQKVTAVRVTGDGEATLDLSR